MAAASPKQVPAPGLQPSVHDSCVFFFLLLSVLLDGWPAERGTETQIDREQKDRETETETDGESKREIGGWGSSHERSAGTAGGSVLKCAIATWLNLFFCAAAMPEAAQPPARQVPVETPPEATKPVQASKAAVPQTASPETPAPTQEKPVAKAPPAPAPATTTVAAAATLAKPAAPVESLAAGDAEPVFDEADLDVPYVTVQFKLPDGTLQAPWQDSSTLPAN